MIKMTEYAKRRKQLMQEIGAADIVILPSAREVSRNGDAFYPFRQNSDFYYLTGFNEPDAVLVLAPKRKEGEYILFNRPRDPEREIWDGVRAGQAGAVKEYLADQSFPIDQFFKMLPQLLVGKESVHYPLGTNKYFDKILLNAVNDIRIKIRGGFQWPTNFKDITPTLHEMRLFKSPAEIDTTKTAIDISKAGFLRALRDCKPGMYEYELEAGLRYEMIRQGGRETAYTSIVGAGKNSCTLHYVTNDSKIKDGDVVLIDAGAEYENYASDITRTFPANGKFSEEQRAIYELVLDSQLAAIKNIKPGSSWDTAQQIIVKIITQGLVDLKILKGRVDDLIEKDAYVPFYMHRSGHWLGLDVHDVGRYKIKNKWRALEPGMVFTVEPGIYIAANIPNVHKRWQNIGVRIEDDVLVTDHGCEVLSSAIPKQIADIESIMSR